MFFLDSSSLAEVVIAYIFEQFEQLFSLGCNIKAKFKYSKFKDLDWILKCKREFSLALHFCSGRARKSFTELKKSITQPTQITLSTFLLTLAIFSLDTSAPKLESQ